jgi:hypothetical protein
LPDYGVVMVGDSFNNESVQFRKVVPLEQERYGLSDPDHTLNMFKIEPVDFAGFFSASINRDPRALYVGQNLTAAGYNQAFEDDYFLSNREVYETPLRVADIGDSSFKAKQWVLVGPCSGAYCSTTSGMIGVVTPALTPNAYCCNAAGRGGAPVLDSTTSVVGFGVEIGKCVVRL